MVGIRPELARQKSSASGTELTIKYLLFFINIAVWIVGVVLLIAGIYAKVKKDLNSLNDTLPWFMDPANLFIIFGSIIFVLTFVGCIGALRENRVLLEIFIYIILFIMLLEVGFVIYVVVDRSRVKRNVEDLLLKTIPKYRDDPDFQSLMDYVQEKVSCCGVKSYDDWENNIYFNCSSSGREACGVPYSCCKNIDTSFNTQCGYDVRRATTSAANRSASIFIDGCVDATIKRFLSGTSLTLTVTAASAAFLMQVITASLAIAVRNRIRDAIARWRSPQSGAMYGGRR